MGYQEDWEEIQSDPEWGNVPADKKRELARFYARKIVRPAVAKGSPELKDFISKNIIEAPKPQGARTRDHLLPEVGETVKAIASHPVQFAKSSAKALADDGLTGQVLREARRVDKAIGGPNINPFSPGFGKPIEYRDDFRHFAPDANPTRAQESGQVFGTMVDPLAAKLPINVLAKAAPVAKTGINLLPKAAAPGAIQQALKEGAGVAGTMGGIGAAQSILTQHNNNQPIDIGEAAKSATVAAALGLPLGMIGGGLPAAMANRATQRGVKAAQARIAASAPDHAYTDPRVNGELIDSVNQAHRLAAENHGAVSNLDDAGVVGAVMSRHKQFDRPGILDEDLMRSKTADYFVGDSVAPDTEGVTPLARAHQPVRPNGPTLAEREEAARQLRAKGTPGIRHEDITVDSPLLDAPAPRLAENPLMAVRPEAPESANVSRYPVKPTPGIRPEQVAIDSPFIDGPAPRLHDNPLMDATPSAPRELASVTPKAPALLRQLVADESGSATVEGALGLPQAKVARDAAVKGVVKAGQGYTAVTEGLTRLGNQALEKVKVKGVSGRQVLDKLEEYRQAAKHGESGELTNELRRYFISNFGVSPKVLALADDASRAAHRAATPMRRQAIVLLKELDSHQQRNLELAVTEPTLRGKMITEIAKATGKQPMVVADLVRSIVDDSTRMTGLLRDVGAVSESGSARWEGQYLPRTYEKMFPTISRLVKAGNTLKGKQGRGVEKVVAQSSVPELQAAGWEFRGEVGGKARVWRDYTLEERFQMAQVFHASQAMGKMANEFERDFRNGKLLADIAKSSDEKGAFAIPASEVKGDPPTGYTLFSNANTRGTGIKRWGALSDHYVREDVAHYLTWASDNSAVLETLRNVKTWTGTNLFKRFKTIWNPAHYVNNFMQNVPMLELAGGSSGDLPLAFREAVTEGELFKQLEEFGTVRNGAVARDLATHLESIQVEDLTPISAMKKALGALQHVEAVGSDIAQATDDLFKVALVQRKMAEGMEFEAAARAAEDVFYEASKVTAPAAQVMEAFGFPFARVLWYQADKLPELLIKNPAKAAVLMSYFAVTKALIDKWNGTTDKQVQAREELIPDHMKKPLGTGFMPLLGRDSKGNQLVLNTGNWSPLGILDNADQVQAPYFPSALMPGGVAPTLYQALNNRDMFRGKDLRTPAGDDTGRFLMENLAPGVISKVGTLADAMAGREAYSGLPYDVPTAALGMLGIKAQPYSPALGIKRKGQEFEAKKSDLEGRIRYLQTMAARNPQDAAKHQAEIKRLIDQITAEGQAFSKQMETAAGAF